MQRLKPVEPQDALKTFVVQKGFSLELAAHEPLVFDPVDGCFDAEGRLYIAEMRGYPYSEEPREMQPKPLGKKNGCRVRRLVDTDGDGIFDQSTVYADQMSWVVSVCCYDDGVFALAPDKLYYFKDTNGDGIADVRRTVLEGFSRYNVQGLANNMKWGLDNRITASGGTAKSTLKKDGQDLGPLSLRDWSLDPKTGTLALVTGGQQFGHSYDDWGNRFVCNNSNHIQQVVFPREALDREGGGITAPPIRSVAVEGAAAPVFRTSPPEPWRIVRTRRRAADPAFRNRLPATELVATGFFTSATGVTIYRGDAYPPEFQGNAFIGDVGGNLIHRKTVQENGVTFAAKRADENVEFITSTDTWFRPTNFVNGPDGCLYILDMYRETIEHPVAIPEDIKEFLDLSSGDDRGRIYRLVPPGWKRRPFPKLGPLTSAELVPHLAATNSWERETAQRLLWERQDKSVVDAIREMARSGKTPLGRLHALSVLDGLGVLDAADLQAALADSDPHLRERGVWLASARLKEMPQLAPAILKLAGDDSVRVQFAVAYAVGEIDSPEALKAINALATRTPANSDVLEMVTSSIGSRALPLLDEVLTNGASDTPWRQRLLLRAASTDAGVAHVLNRVAAIPASGGPARLVGVLGTRVEASGRSLAAIVESPAVESGAREKVQSIWADAEKAVINREETLKSRLAAVPVILTLPAARFESLLGELLSPQTPPELQTAVITGLGGLNADLSAPLLAAWPQFGPQLRTAAMTTLLRRNTRTKALLAAVKEGTIAPSEVDPTARQSLLSNPDTGIRELAVAAFGTPNKDRQMVIDDYRPALDLAGDVARGRQAFTKHCSACHRAEDKGANVGPALTSVTNKSPEDLVVAIFDPSPEVVAIGVEHAHALGWSYAALGAGVVLSQVLAGAGATLQSFLLDVAILVIVIPTACVVVLGFDAERVTLWHVLAVGNVLGAAAFAAWVIRGKFFGGASTR